MPIAEMERLVDQVIAIRAERVAPHLIAALTDRLELLHADRLAALVELAMLRGVTLGEVMNRLSIQLPLV
jgi:hypothetical protein